MLAIEVEDEILKYDKFNSTFFPLLLFVVVLWTMFPHVANRILDL